MVITVIPVPHNQARLFVKILVFSYTKATETWSYPHDFKLHNILLFFFLVIQRILFKLLSITLIFAKYFLYITARLFRSTISYVMSSNVSFKPIINVSLHMPRNMLLLDMTWQICHINNPCITVQLYKWKQISSTNLTTNWSFLLYYD